MKCFFNLTLIMLKIWSHSVLDAWIMVFRVRLKYILEKYYIFLQQKIGID